MARLGPPKELTAEQKPVAERIVKMIGQLGGPYGAWIHRPELASRIHALSDYFREHAVLPPKARLVAVLRTVAHWGAQFPWAAQVAQATNAGLPVEAVAAIGEGRKPSLADPAEEAAYDVASELLVQHAISAATYARARERLGEGGVVELVALVGHFSTVSLTAQAFEIETSRTPAAPLKVK